MSRVLERLEELQRQHPPPPTAEGPRLREVAPPGPTNETALRAQKARRRRLIVFGGLGVMLIAALVRPVLLKFRANQASVVTLVQEESPQAPGAALAARAGELLKQKRIAEATTLLEKGVELEPANSNLLINLAFAYKESGDLARARATLNRALQIAPDDAVAHNNSGRLYFVEQKWDDAIRSYERALGLDPDYPEARVNLAAALEKAERWALAIETYERFLKGAPRGQQELRQAVELRLRFLRARAAFSADANQLRPGVRQ